MTRICYKMTLAVLLVASGSVPAQSGHDDIARVLGLAPVPDSGTEVRVWLESNARVSELYRIAKTDGAVLAERFVFADVVRSASNGWSVKEASRETKTNRRLLEQQRCSGQVSQTSDYLWCRIAIRDNGPWSLLFDDLLPEELWNLPPQARRSCGSFVILDGVTVTIEILEPSRQHSVSYSNPDVCCGTVACAIVDHARAVVGNIY